MGIRVSSSHAGPPDVPVAMTAEELARRPLGRRRVLWFHNEANHYFVAMLDALNAQGGAQYVAMFLCPSPAGVAIVPGGPGSAGVRTRLPPEKNPGTPGRNELTAIDEDFAPPGKISTPPPAGSVLLALPGNSPFMFLGSAPAHELAGATMRPLRADARAMVQAGAFDMAIVGGYDLAYKRWILAHCRSRRIPTAVFADSNIHAEFDGTVKSFCRRMVKKVLLRKIIRLADQILPANSSGIAYWRYYGCPREKLSLATYYSEVAAPQETGGTAPDGSRETGDGGGGGGGGGGRRQEREGAGAALGIEPGKRLLFTGARLARVKGLHLMIDAFARLGLAEKGWVWAIAGGGPLEARLKEHAGALTGKGIYFLGVLSHSRTKALAAGCDIFVLPSTYEPHGIVISEAMGAGTPVIASDACGAAIDLVEPGKTGWLFANGSVEDLQRVLKAATDNPAGLQAMRPACRAKYEAWYGQYSPLVAVPKVVERLCGAAGK